MPSILQGLHHVTATVGEAQPDLDFFAGLLGLRLVKTTVNFDNHFVYHFYYGDGVGSPGSVMTTFPYAGMGVRVGRKGAGQIGAIAFSVPPESMDFWRRRLVERGAAVADGAPRFGEPVLTVSDPSGLVLELVGAGGDRRKPWTTPEIGHDAAIRGLHHVSLTLHDAGPSRDFLNGPLGFEVAGEEGPRTRLAVLDNTPGRLVDLVHSPDAPPAVNGLGTVHHVAFGIPDAEHQLRIRDELVRTGRAVTEVMDRQYFRSIYFREPGGVLYEIATVGPGFAVDEPPDRLGAELRLPPWEEPHRAEIESRLPSITRP